MRRHNWWRLGGLVALAALAGIVLLFMPVKWGLDLEGGVHVVLEAKATESVRITADVMEQTQAVIERRVNALGVAEPIVQRQGDRRIIVQLPGVHDQEQAVEAIGKTATLEVRDPMGGVVLTGADLRSASMTVDQFNRPAVSIEFKREAAVVFANLTRKYLGTQAIPIYLDDELLVAPVPEAVVTDGQAIITGAFTQSEARNLAIQLQAGALPVPLEVSEVRNVGPVLGQESVDRSLRAGMLGVGLVFVFMLAYYRLPGLAADIALGLYVLFLLAIIVGIQATLTLPGLAGIILSIGMAVDANVIIFERVKEELQAGKRLRAGIDAGWRRAFSAIFDANLTTLITTAVLYYFGTGPVRGFAVTLSVGIVVSLFTALVVTRTLLNLMVNGRQSDRMLRQFGLKEVAAK